MSTSYSVTLIGPAPWGFRLQGGKDFCLPLTISRLTDGGKAAKAKMSIGDIIVSINGISTDSMNHLEAQNKIKASTDQLSLTMQRPSSAPKDGAPKGEPQEIIKPVPINHPASSPALTKPSNQPSPAYNKTARPFGGSSSPTPTLVAPIPSESSAFTPAASHASQPPQRPFPLKPSAGVSESAPSDSKPGSARSTFTSTSASTSSSSNSSSPARMTAPPSHPSVPQPSVYNTPINLYSNTNACEVALGQRRGLLESQGLSEQFNGKPVTEPDLNHASPLSDASKKRLIEDTEDWHPRTGVSQSRSFRLLAQLTGTEDEQLADNSGKNEEDKPAAAVHTSAAAKTYSKSAAAPRNGNVASPSTFRSPVSQSRGAAPSGFPKGGALPSFGKVSTPASKGPDRPTPQPHPQDLDSLVQRAEHIPAGTRTPMCSKCNSVIR